MYSLSRTLFPKPPYAITPHLARFSLPGRPTPYIYYGEARAWRRLLWLDGWRIPVAVEARASGEPWRPRIAITVYSEKNGVLAKAVEMTANCLRIGFDYNAFLEKLRSHPPLYRLASRYPGLRPGRTLSLYEALIDVVLKQRIALRLALYKTAELVEKYGEKMCIGERCYYSLPRPRRLARLAPEKLRESIRLPRIKARALVEIARAEAEGRLPSTEEALRSPEKTVEELMEIYGVGRWSAELAIAMVHDKFPIGPLDDLAVKRGLERLYGRELSRKEAADLLGELGEYMGLILYLAAYLYEEEKRRR